MCKSDCCIVLRDHQGHSPLPSKRLVYGLVSSPFLHECQSAVFGKIDKNTHCGNTQMCKASRNLPPLLCHDPPAFNNTHTHTQHAAHVSTVFLFFFFCACQLHHQCWPFSYNGRGASPQMLCFFYSIIIYFNVSFKAGTQTWMDIFFVHLSHWLKHIKTSAIFTI